MLKFSDCRIANDPSIFALVAQISMNVVGSLAVKEWPGGDISIARLFVAPDWRRQGIGRQMMRYALELYPDSVAWLYAGPYTWEEYNLPGAATEALQRFYMSLGFTMASDDDGNPVMVRRKTCL